MAGGQAQLRCVRGLAVGSLGLACAAAAWASYGNMRLDGLGFLLAVVVLYQWGILLAFALALGWGKRKVFVIPATVVTSALVVLLIMAFGDGSATMQQRPLGGWAMFVVLLLAAVPVMLVAPIPQFAGREQGTSSRFPKALLIGALALVPIGAILHVVLQEIRATRVIDEARTVAPGRILPHVIASRQRAASSWLSPYLWSEEEQLKWIIIGLGLGIVDSPEPLSAEDTQALELLVKASAGSKNEYYVGKLDGKLVWDRLMRATADDRPAVAAGLTKQQAQHFIEGFGVPHADWLCVPLTEPQAEKAFEHIWTLLQDHQKKEFSTALREKCGRSIGAPAK